MLVNTDFRRPRLSRAVRQDEASELPFLLEDLATVKIKSLLTPTDLNGMVMMDLSSIQATPGELMRATEAKIGEIASVSNAVVIDTSPVGATAEVLDIVPLADVIVVVARVGHTSIEAAARTVAVLRDLTTAPMVLALNGLKQERAQYYEYTDKRDESLTDGFLKRFARQREPV